MRSRRRRGIGRPNSTGIDCEPAGPPGSGAAPRAPARRGGGDGSGADPAAPRPSLLYARRCQAHSDVKASPASESKDVGSSSQSWRIKMLYDGECPLCMREASMDAAATAPTPLLTPHGDSALSHVLRVPAIKPITLRFMDDSQGFMLGNDYILLHVVGSARVLNHEEMGHVDC
ncbi:uncharacterized protein LOC119294693 [Triticum dicoccoides]|uniref:uncharacterized protein LOC119294693 n=1 Tax=Triticum dicoccoides TaxID=85692 RepID=UPI000E7ACF32|nr:uncharacterized protein LOC119294693 [Triticum dicoccoides]